MTRLLVGISTMHRDAFYQFLFRWIYYCHSRGQLISKCLFGVSNSPKTNLKTQIFAQKFFVCFLGELKKPKCPFEINWPVVNPPERKLAKRTSVHTQSRQSNQL